MIKPLYKSRDKICLENYRPTSLTWNIGNFFVKSIKLRLVNYVEIPNLPDVQYGFREKRNTQHIIENLNSNIYNRLDNGQITVAVFMELSKSFVTISHDSLIVKLESVGIRCCSEVTDKLCQ